MFTRRLDWDAEVYHRVSEPQFEWGQRVLERLELRGDERVLDAGCGTGRLTALLHAQCGGEGNLAALNLRVRSLMCDSRYAARFADWREPWLFLGAEPAAALLSAVGFTHVQTRLRSAPARFASRETYREFVEVVALADYLARIDGVQEREALVDTLVEAAAADDPPYVLDYVRLELEATRPGEAMDG